MARVFVTRRLGHDVLRLLTERHEVDMWPTEEPPSRAELVEHACKASGLLSMVSDRIDAELLEACPELRVVATYAVGTDNIDLDAAAARGIAVGNTPDVLTDATADLAFGLLLAASRRILEGDRAVRAGRWSAWKPGWLVGADVSGSTLGIVGYGKIGQAMARRGRGFGMEVLWSGSSSGVPIDELLERSDHVSLHCPLTAQTRRLLDAEALSAMKPTATLVNTARGPLIDQDALVAALTSGEIGAAGLDVTDPEPLPPEHALLGLSSVVISPHIGSASVRARAAMASLAVANLLTGLAGEPMPQRVV